MLDVRYCAFGIAILAAGVLAGGPGAVAGPVADQAAKAEALLQPPSANPGAALQSFDLAIDAFWKQLPLTIRAAAFADKISGYGQYAPRPTSVFRPGEESHVYLALAGYTLRPISTGFRVEFNTSVKIENPDGSVLAREDDFAELISQYTVENHEYYADFEVGLPDLKPGKYVLDVTVRDVQSNKMTTADLPFSIMPQADAPPPPPPASPAQ